MGKVNRSPELKKQLEELLSFFKVKKEHCFPDASVDFWQLSKQLSERLTKELEIEDIKEYFIIQVVRNLIWERIKDLKKRYQ